MLLDAPRLRDLIKDIAETELYNAEFTAEIITEPWNNGWKNGKARKINVLWLHISWQQPPLT